MNLNALPCPLAGILYTTVCQITDNQEFSCAVQDFFSLNRRNQSFVTAKEGTVVPNITAAAISSFTNFNGHLYGIGACLIDSAQQLTCSSGLLEDYGAPAQLAQGVKQAFAGGQLFCSLLLDGTFGCWTAGSTLLQLPAEFTSGIRAATVACGSYNHNVRNISSLVCVASADGSTQCLSVIINHRVEESPNYQALQYLVGDGQLTVGPPVLLSSGHTSRLSALYTGYFSGPSRESFLLCAVADGHDCWYLEQRMDGALSPAAVGLQLPHDAPIMAIELGTYDADEAMHIDACTVDIHGALRCATYGQQLRGGPPAEGLVPAAEIGVPTEFKNLGKPTEPAAGICRDMHAGKQPMGGWVVALRLCG